MLEVAFKDVYVRDLLNAVTLSKNLSMQSIRQISGKTLVTMQQACPKGTCAVITNSCPWSRVWFNLSATLFQ
uniref:Uncharacterized protein n=1 Tax=Trichogramma kaykai TaxID=54128 RepID=A0ABD2XSA4_9HYME